MYLGMLSILIGTAIYLQSIFTFIPSIVFIILIEKVFIPIEEKNLAKQFGKEYKRYKNKVRRWL
jgi:protein-S-isoprenylcysteine O-methyltransferase Ste14